ncbi:MAG: alpha/beta fold hydrolase [Nitrospiraceae bacterium]
MSNTASGAHRTIDIDGVKIALTDEGSGSPIVLLHGFPLNRRMWDPQRETLAAHARVIAIDLRGHGDSDAPLWRYSMDQFSDDVIAVLDHLGLAQATILGLSMGGYVALALARRHATRVRALVLMDTRAQADTPEGRAGRFRMAQAAHTQGPSAVADTMLPKLLAPATLTDRPQLVQQVRAMIERMAVSGIAGDLMAMADRSDSTSVLATIVCPTLIVVGEQDQATPPADARYMAERIPHARLTIVPGAGHLPNLESPQIVNETVITFLASLA